MASRSSAWPKSLARLNRRAVSGRWYRMVAQRYRSALDSDEGARRAGGRYNPLGTGALYFGETPDACRAEIARRVDPLPRLALGTFEVKLQAVCDLTDPSVRAALRVSLGDLTGGSWIVTQALGPAIRAAGFEALLAPSAAGPSSNLVVFRDQLQAGSSVRLVTTADVEPTPP